MQQPTWIVVIYFFGWGNPFELSLFFEEIPYFCLGAVQGTLVHEVGELEGDPILLVGSHQNRVIVSGKEKMLKQTRHGVALQQKWSILHCVVQIWNFARYHLPSRALKGENKYTAHAAKLMGEKTSFIYC